MPEIISPVLDLSESDGNRLRLIGVVEAEEGVIGIGGVEIGSFVGSSAHFLFTPTPILLEAAVLIIKTKSNTVDKSSIRG